MTISAYEASLIGTSKAGGALSALSSNENTFLTLLTTQLKNQDPTNPTDTSKFTEQLVQYSQVEQQIQSNQKLDTLTKLQGNAQVQSALYTIGKDVQFQGNTFNYSGTGSYTVDYNLPTASAATTIVIQDAKGNTVYQANGNLTAGDNTFSWDGKQSDGSAAPAGNYTVAVTAKDVAGTNISPIVSLWGQVTSVEASGTDILLMMNGGNAISLNDVSNIQNHQSTSN